MSDKSKSSGPTGKIEYIENHRPALPSGDYRIQVKQSITTQEILPSAEHKPPTINTVHKSYESQAREFSILGPRFTLEPEVVREVFPPAGSLGEHSSVLPHISFNRSTLPWERFAALPDEKRKQAQAALEQATVRLANNETERRHATAKNPLDTPELKTPWLALLVFDQYELEARQDLTKIKGIASELEKKLNQQGIFNYQQIAELTKEAIEHLEASLIKFKGRIERDNWIENAKILARKNPVVLPKVLKPASCTLAQDEGGHFWSLKPDSKEHTPEFLHTPVFHHEFGQQESDPVTVIDVAGDLLNTILPSPEDVQLMGHVRRPTDDHGTLIGDEVATLIANRLPEAGHMSIVHLVSLEGVYGEGVDKDDIWDLYKDAKTYVRLVSLKNWRFTCVDEKHSFKGLLHHLNKEYLFSIDQKRVETLPSTIDEALLTDGVAAEFVKHLSVTPPLTLSKWKSEKSGKQADTWQIIDGKGKQFVIRREAAIHRVYQNDKYLFDLTGEQASKLHDVQEPDVQESKVPAEIITVFDHHRALSEKTTVRLDRDVWIIEDTQQHHRFVIRRQMSKNRDGECLAVFQNQKFISELSIKHLDDLSLNVKQQVIPKKVSQLINALSDKATIRKERVETWRVTDTEGSSYMIRRNGKRYEVHRNLPHTLRLPTDHLVQARHWVEQGYVAMPHEMRQGNRSASWYHGPLAPGRVGYELLLLSTKKVKSIPAKAVNTVIVAKVSGKLYFRVFDDEGLMVSGKSETDLLEFAAEIAVLKKKLKGLWKKENLDASQEEIIVRSVRSILSLTGQFVSSEGSLRARSADQLVRYNPANGMFDVSYAAAWELGRLLTIQNEKVAVSLLQWKRRHRHGQERLSAMRELEHLPVIGRSADTDLPADVRRWFGDLALLHGVPFNYMVPDERMLPQESIRFFWVDPEWIRCLHDGVFSIGRVLSSDHKRDEAHEQDKISKPHGIVTGFLLRSEVVSGWPYLQVDGYDEAVMNENYEHDTISPKGKVKSSIPFDRFLMEDMNKGDASQLVPRFKFVNVATIVVNPIVADSSWLVNVNDNETLYLINRSGGKFLLSIENRLPILRMERLSPNVLLCLFAGDIKTIDIHQKPEALHFGCNRSVEGNAMKYYRELKTKTGGELPGA